MKTFLAFLLFLTPLSSTMGATLSEEQGNALVRAIQNMSEECQPGAACRNHQVLIMGGTSQAVVLNTTPSEAHETLDSRAEEEAQIEEASTESPLVVESVENPLLITE